MLAILLTFSGVNSYVLSHGIRMSTLMGTLSLSLILYSRAPSSRFQRVLPSIVRRYLCIILLSHPHRPYMPSLYYDCGPESVSVYS